MNFIWSHLIFFILETFFIYWRSNTFLWRLRHLDWQKVFFIEDSLRFSFLFLLLNLWLCRNQLLLNNRLLFLLRYSRFFIVLDQISKFFGRCWGWWCRWIVLNYREHEWFIKWCILILIIFNIDLAHRCITLVTNHTFCFLVSYLASLRFLLID